MISTLARMASDVALGTFEFSGPVFRIAPQEYGYASFPAICGAHF